MVLGRRSNHTPPLPQQSLSSAAPSASSVSHRKTAINMALPRFSATPPSNVSARGARGPRGYFAIIVLALAVAYATSMSLSFFQGQTGVSDMAPRTSGSDEAGGANGSGNIDAALQGFSNLMYSFYSAGHSMIMPRLMAAQALFNANSSGTDAGGESANEWVEQNPESPGGDGEGEDSGPFASTVVVDIGEDGASEEGEGGEGGDEEEEEEGEASSGPNGTATGAGARNASAGSSTSDGKAGGSDKSGSGRGDKSGKGSGRKRGGRRRSGHARDSKEGSGSGKGEKEDGGRSSTSGGKGVSAQDGPAVSPLPDTPHLAAERARYGNRSHPLGPLDVQILRDLSPWTRSGGFSFEDLLATRAQRAPLVDRVTNFSSGLITCVIKGNVAYMLGSEIKAIREQYGVGSKGKIRDFLAMMTAVARVYKLPDAWFLWNVHPWPLLRTRTGGAPPPSIESGRFAAHSDSAVVTAPKGLAPVLSLCKTDGEIDVLYPNMYFQTPNYWWRVTQSIAKAADAWPFPKRKAKVWWRGASGWTWPAAAPRVLTLARWHAKPWADLAFTSPWRTQLREWAKEKAPWRRTLPRSVAKIPSGPEMRTSMEAVARYKYALQLPGSYGATYSRTLQFLVWTGAAVFFYDCPYYEFYYHHLVPWEHYVPVNVTNLGERVRWANANQGKVEKIAAASHRFARERLTAGHFALYWKQLLDLYSELQRFKVKLPGDACTCWPLTKRNNPEASRPRWVPHGTKRCEFICDFGVHR